MTTDVASKETLEKALAEATANLAAKRDTLKSEANAALAADDITVATAKLGEIKTLESAVSRAKETLDNHVAGERFAALANTNRPILNMLSRLQANPPTVSVSAISGDIAIDAEGNVTVTFRPVIGKPDFTELEAAVKQAVVAGKDAYKSAAVSNMTFNVPDLGKEGTRDAATLGPAKTGSATPRKATAKQETSSASNNGGGIHTYNGMKAYDYIAYVKANHPDIVSQHDKSFAAFDAMGSKMNGLSNLAKTVASKLSHPVV